MALYPQKVAVCSRSFSKNEELKNCLQETFPNSYFNEDGVSLNGESLIEFLADSKYALTALEKIDDLILSQTPDLRLSARSELAQT